MLYDTLKSDMREAMRARDAVRLQTLRLAVAACTNALVEKKMKPTEALDDTEVIAVLKRQVKQRNEAAEQYRVAGQEKQAAAEEAERAVLETYLPPETAEEDIRRIVEETKQELGVSEKKNQGLLMKGVMSKLQGQADGSKVAKIVGELLV